MIMRAISSGPALRSLVVRKRSGKVRVSVRVSQGLLVVLAAVTGCVGHDDEPSERVESNVRDSLGIQIAEVTGPAWRVGGPWRVGEPARLSLGARSSPQSSTAADVIFERVQGVETLSDGSVVVADAGPATVSIFSPSGALQARVGGRGEGPGELVGISSLFTCGDLIGVVDPRQTVHVFQSDGTYLRQIQSGGGTVEGLSRDCIRSLVRRETSRPPVESQGLTEYLLAWVDPAADVVDTVATKALLEAWTRRFRGGARPWVLPWGTSSRTLSVWSGQVAVGYGRMPEVVRYDPQGHPALIVRWHAEPLMVTRGDRERYRAARARFLGAVPSGEESALLFPALDEYPDLPTTKPLFDRILHDAEGGIWVRHFPEESFGLFDSRLDDPPVPTEEWTVFDSSGVWVSTLRMPPRFELHAVRDGFVYGVARDDLMVESVQAFDIERHRSANSW